MPDLITLQQDNKTFIIDNREDKSYKIKNPANAIIIDGLREDREISKNKMAFYTRIVESMEDAEQYKHCSNMWNFPYNFAYELCNDGCTSLLKRILVRYEEEPVGSFWELISVCVRRRNYNCLKNLVNSPQFAKYFAFIVQSDVNFNALTEVAKYLLFSKMPDNIFKNIYDAKEREYFNTNVKYLLDNNLITMKHWEQAVHNCHDAVRFLLQHQNYFTEDLSAYPRATNNEVVLNILKHCAYQAPVVSN